MGFCNEWEIQYANNNHMSVWPWSDLISCVMRYTDIKAKNYNVLELGCGAGANIPFFKALGSNYYGIDGSKTIIESLHKRFPEYKENIICDDFTERINFSNSFDLIIDRASLTHNCAMDIEKTINLIYDKLESGGFYIGIDWFSINHDEYKLGDFISGDKFTIKNKGNKNRYFDNLGNVHFSDENYLLKLLHNFNIILLEEKIIKIKQPENYTRAAWNFVVKKEKETK